MGSIQEKWLNFKQRLQGGDWALCLLILGVAGGSFWLGQQSVQFSSHMEDLSQTQFGQVIPRGDSATNSGRLMRDEVVPEVKGWELVNSNQPQSATLPNEESSPVEIPVVPAPSGAYVASKNGTKYHLPWCAGAQAIKAENKIWFATKAEAERAGYTPAANCKGI